MISAISNEAVPAPEVEQPKKRKGWTLFRNKKQKTEENVKKGKNSWLTGSQKKLILKNDYG